MGGGATPAAPAVSSTAPKVPSRPPPRPGAATPQPPSVDLGAAPNADTLTAPAVPEPAASAALSASPAPEPTAVPAAYDLGEPAGPPPRPKQNKTLEMVAPAAAAKSAKPARPTPASPTGGAEAKRATNLEDAIRKPLSAENTEIMIRDAPAEPLPTRSPTPTLEMAIADHSAAASKDPAPPESKSLKAEEAKEAHDAPTSGARAAAAKAARVVENTDSTAVTEHGDGDDDDDGNETDDDELQLKRPAMQVPMSAVLGVSAAWVIGLVVFFFVGRVSGFKSAGNQPTAKEGPRAGLPRAWRDARHDRGRQRDDRGSRRAKALLGHEAASSLGGERVEDGALRHAPAWRHDRPRLRARREQGRRPAHRSEGRGPPRASSPAR
jgi:hypothetical protein